MGVLPRAPNVRGRHGPGVPVRQHAFNDRNSGRYARMKRGTDETRDLVTGDVRRHRLFQKRVADDMCSGRGAHSGSMDEDSPTDAEREAEPGLPETMVSVNAVHVADLS